MKSKRRILKALLMASIAVAVGVGVAYAFSNPAVKSPFYLWWGEDGDNGPPTTPSNVNFWQYGSYNNVTLEADGDQGWTDSVSFYLDPSLGGLTTDAYGQARASVLVERVDGDDAKAWMTGSGGGMVECDEDGNVTITMGS